MAHLFSHKGLLNGKVTGKALEIGVCFTASSGFFLLGYDQGVMSGIITEKEFLKTFPQMDQKNAKGAVQALVVAIYEVGCLIGALAMVAFGDTLGRRRAVLTGAAIMVVGAIIQTAAVDLASLIVGRIVTGIGNGMNTSTIPVWQSEMAPPKIRGFLVLFEGALITGGIMLAYWMNYGFYFVSPEYTQSVASIPSFQWRFPIAFQIIFAIILIIGVLLFPESPRWLLKHGKEDVAAEIMAWQHEAKPDDPIVREDIDEINELNAISMGKKLTLKELFSNGKEMNLWRFSAACGSQCLQQISGINLVTYYSTVVFEDSLQFAPSMSRFMTGWLGTEYFLAACLALFIVDKYGRRNLMMWGALGMAICLAVIGGCLKYGTPQNRKPAIAATVFIFLYDTCFAIGWLGVTWLYPAEVTSIRIRAQTTGFSTATNWIFNYIVVQIAPIMINTIAWKTYMVFMCTNIAAIPLVYFFFPETNGWKLETLDAIAEEAWSKGENIVFAERRWRKSGWKSRKDSQATLQPGGFADSNGETKKDVSDEGNMSHDEEKRNN